jgi:hypothetical protein
MPHVPPDINPSTKIEHRELMSAITVAAILLPSSHAIDLYLNLSFWTLFWASS